MTLTNLTNRPLPVDDDDDSGEMSPSSSSGSIPEVSAAISGNPQSDPTTDATVAAATSGDNEDPYNNHNDDVASATPNNDTDSTILSSPQQATTNANANANANATAAEMETSSSASLGNHHNDSTPTGVMNGNGNHASIDDDNDDVNHNSSLQQEQQQQLPRDEKQELDSVAVGKSSSDAADTDTTANTATTATDSSNVDNVAATAAAAAVDTEADDTKSTAAAAAQPPPQQQLLCSQCRRNTIPIDLSSLSSSSCTNNNGNNNPTATNQTTSNSASASTTPSTTTTTPTISPYCLHCLEDNISKLQHKRRYYKIREGMYRDLMHRIRTDQGRQQHQVMRMNGNRGAVDGDAPNSPNNNSGNNAQETADHSDSIQALLERKQQLLHQLHSVENSGTHYQDEDSDYHQMDETPPPTVVMAPRTQSSIAPSLRAHMPTYSPHPDLSSLLHEENTLRIQYSTLLSKRESLLNQLTKLVPSHMLNEAFRIDCERLMGTINSLRLGRLPIEHVDWFEVNAALGQVALLLYSVSLYKYLPMMHDQTSSNSSVQAESNHISIQPKGAFSKIRKGSTTYDLVGGSGLGFFWKRKFDHALKALLELLNQLCQEAERSLQQPPPYEIKGDLIGGFSIRYSEKNEDKWTLALKCVLLNCKYLLLWVSTND